MADPARAVSVGSALRGPRDTVYALDWSGDGSMLVGASKDGSVWIWDVADPADPRVEATLSAVDGNVYAVTLSPDDGRVSAGGSDRAVTTWHVDAEEVAASTCARTGTPMSEAEWQQLAPGVPYTAPCPE